jgi:hypothetical protein
MDDKIPELTVGNDPPNETHQWEKSRQLVQAFGILPSPISGVIRLLTSEFSQAEFKSKLLTPIILVRLLHSDSFKAPYYYSIMLFKPDCFQGLKRPFSTPNFLDAYSATEHAFLSGLIFTVKRARVTCDPNGFSQVVKRLQLGVNLGWSIGSFLTPIGLLNGLLAGTYRWLGTLPFLRQDPEGFERYMKHIERSQLALPDEEYERSEWGCTSAQNGILLLQFSGFRSSTLTPLYEGTRPSILVPRSNSLEFFFCATDIWLRYFLEETSSPRIALPGELYLDEKDRGWISTCVADTEPSKNANWLLTGKDDISVKQTPHLFLPDPNDHFADIPGYPEENGQLVVEA